MKNENGVHRVLFVCTGNAYRSPISEALLKKLGPDWVVDSAGTKIAKKSQNLKESDSFTISFQAELLSAGQ